MNRRNSTSLSALLTNGAAGLVQISSLQDNLSRFLLKLLNHRTQNFQLRGRYLLSTKIGQNLLLLTNSDQDSEFLFRYRISPRCFWSIEDKLVSNGVIRNRGWNLRIEMLVFLLWLSSGASIIIVADAFDIPPETALDLCKKALLKIEKLTNSVIRLPSTSPQLSDIAAGFEKKATTKVFSKVVGVVGSTLVRISTPKKDKEQYLDQRGDYSIKLTIICDSKMRILHAVSGCPGSLHESKVLLDSSLLQIPFPPKPFMIIGDQGYRCLEEPVTILTPYEAKDGTLSIQQLAFNKILSRMHTPVEHAIGLLKLRWRKLMDLVRSKSLHRTTRVIIAACILHNICLSDYTDFEEFFQDECEQEAKRLRREKLYPKRRKSSTFSTNEAIYQRTDDYDIRNQFPEAVFGEKIRDSICSQIQISQLNPGSFVDKNFWFSHIE